jgi:hypothetical protein
MSRRVALLIGNTDYDDRGLAKLNSPEMDLRELAGLLQDPQIGAFDEVTPFSTVPLPTSTRPSPNSLPTSSARIHCCFISPATACSMTRAGCTWPSKTRA